MPTDEEILQLIETIEAAKAEEPQGDIPEDTENWQQRYSDAASELEKANSRIEVLEEQNKRLFDSMSKMVKSIPVSSEAPKQPQTQTEREEDLRANYDIRKLDFT